MLYAPWRNLSFDYSVDFAHNNLNTTMIQWQSPSRNSLWQTISAKYSNSRLTAIARVLWTNCWDDNDKSHNHENRIMPSVSLSYNILPQGQLMQTIDGTKAASIANLPSGIYIVKTNNKTTKIVKK